MWFLPCISILHRCLYTDMDLRPGWARLQVMHAPGDCRLHTHTVLSWARLQVLDEIGVDLGATMGAAPRTKVAQRQQEPSTSRPNQETEGLEARLAALR